MKATEPSWNEIEKIITELINYQKAKLLQCGQRLVPELTPEDLLQPNDYLELENHPHFRYEEGLLAGVQTLQTALRAYKMRLQS